jgi:hypothetical protein
MGVVMIIDADDSEAMWCPMARVYNPVAKVSGFNAVTEYENGKPIGTLNETIAHCKASSCMMWRYINDDPDDHGGYCGLAGKPLRTGD